MATGYEDLIPTKNARSSGYEDLIPKQAAATGIPGHGSVAFLKLLASQFKPLLKALSAAAVTSCLAAKDCLVWVWKKLAQPAQVNFCKKTLRAA